MKLVEVSEVKAEKGRIIARTDGKEEKEIVFELKDTEESNVLLREAYKCGKLDLSHREFKVQG